MEPLEQTDESETPDLIDEPLRETVNAILSRAGLDGYVLKRDENSQIGLNFMGSIVELIARKKQGPTDLNIVAKCGIKKSAFYESFGARISYEIERYMYEEVIPRLCEFQLAKLGPSERVCPHVGGYYGASLDRYEEVFVFENLKTLGFKTLNSKVTLDVPHVEMVLRELAGYHAACFAFKDQKPNEWMELVSDENIGRVNYFFRDDQLEEIALRLFKKLEKVFDNEGEHELAVHLGAFTDNIREHIAAFTRKDQHSIINHGDVWCSNIMFKYGDVHTPNRPTEIRLIDWQASRVGHLCIDLAYFLYMSASYEILADLDRYLHFYYAEFCERVRALASDPRRLFPYESFAEQWRVCSPYALIVISNVLIANYMEPDEFPDFAAVAESGGNVYRCVDVDFRRLGDYNERMKTLVKLSVERKSF